MITFPQIAYNEVTELPFSKQLDSDKYDTVKVRGLTAGEVKELAKKNVDSLTMKEIRDIYDNGVILVQKDGKDVSINELIEADLYYLMFLVNILTQPDFAIPYRAKCSNSKCDYKTLFDVRIDNVQFKPIPVPKFPIPIKMSFNETFYLQPLTMGDLLKAYDICSKDKDLAPTEVKLAMSLNLGKYEDDVEATDDVGRVKEKIKALQGLHSSDLKNIDKKYQLLSFELQPIKVVCENKECKRENTFNLQVNLKDLIPLI